MTNLKEEVTEKRIIGEIFEANIKQKEKITDPYMQQSKTY